MGLVVVPCQECDLRRQKKPLDRAGYDADKQLEAVVRALCDGVGAGVTATTHAAAATALIATAELHELARNICQDVRAARNVHVQPRGEALHRRLHRFHGLDEVRDGLLRVVVLAPREHRGQEQQLRGAPERALDLVEELQLALGFVEPARHDAAPHAAHERPRRALVGLRALREVRLRRLVVGAQDVLVAELSEHRGVVGCDLEGAVKHARRDGQDLKVVAGKARKRLAVHEEQGRVRGLVGFERRDQLREHARGGRELALANEEVQGEEIERVDVLRVLGVHTLRRVPRLLPLPTRQVRLRLEDHQRRRGHRERDDRLREAFDRFGVSADAAVVLYGPQEGL
eukprot:PhM_4_TR15957/c0_g1_i1/m.102860